MLKISRTVRIEWGDCDPAGIVYFPNYFIMFDIGTSALFEAAIGMTKFQFLKAHNLVGYPLVEARANFLKPSRFGDDVIIETAVTEIKRSSFSLQHRLTNQGELAVEGFEKRVLVGRDPNDPDKIKSSPIPPEVVARLSGR
jgi:4-hydroxybenzoyl-CoA thioesterase